RTARFASTGSRARTTGLCASRGGHPDRSGRDQIKSVSGGRKSVKQGVAWQRSALVVAVLLAGLGWLAYRLIRKRQRQRQRRASPGPSGENTRPRRPPPAGG